MYRTLPELMEEHRASMKAIDGRIDELLEAALNGNAPGYDAGRARELHYSRENLWHQLLSMAEEHFK